MLFAAHFKQPSTKWNFWPKLIERKTVLRRQHESVDISRFIIY